MQQDTGSCSGVVWKAIPGYEGLYEVSDMGDVRRLPVTIKRMLYGKLIEQRTPGKVLSASKKSVYPMLALCKDGVPKHKYVHELVALAFIGPRPEGMQVRHRDGDHHNPKLTNLRYGTPTENSMDRHEHGTMLCGVRNPMNRHPVNLIERIIMELTTKTIKQVSEELSINYSVVRDIRNNRNWKQLSRPWS